MSFDPAFAASVVPKILASIGTTLGVTVLSCMFSAALGFLMEVVRRRNAATRLGLRFLIDVIRSTPVLVQIYFLYYVLPVYGIRLPALVVGVGALSVYYSGYLAEVFKAGIDSIPRGQWEAARSLGLRTVPTLALVIAPQMLRNVAAPVGGYFISIFKSTPYLAVIAVPEAFGSAIDVASDTFRYAEPMLAAGVVFLAIALVMSALVRWLEMRMALSAKR
ncbi:amino acid ABC transporter permease [Inquilinus sp.]|jgi:polar amino acid transport system permease protein|uniref:amino acid ABC transporter permease n=1 Tax=Inquilinus sp. TaxID=1932117 RepID=UPI003783B54F